MSSVVGPIVLGILIAILGIFNMKGNISSVHWYHRTRVSPEDKPKFGKCIGLGTILIGSSMIVFGVFSFITEKTGSEIFTMIGSIFVIIGTIAGLVMSLYAMIKYNNGIFHFF